MADQPPLLWQQPDFRALWLAQAVSSIGSGVSGLALPLTAVLTLGAGAGEMGLLRAADQAPILLFALLAGVWVDRLRRRPLMIAADLGRTVLVGAIPGLALLGWLRLEHLYALAFLAGTLTVFFDLASTSLLPTLTPRARLVEANGYLSISFSTARVVGPGLAGWLVGLIGAPVAVALDALSFLLSALCLGSIRTPEVAPPAATQRRPVWTEMLDGFSLLWQQPVIRAVTLASSLAALGASIQQTVVVLYATQSLGLSPVLLGSIIAGGGVASLLGAVLVGPLAHRIGSGWTLIAGQLLSAVGASLLPAADSRSALAVPLLLLGHLLGGAGLSIYSVTQISLRQALTPDSLLGRVNASRRLIVFGVMPLGSLLAGSLGESAGLQPTLVVGAVAMWLALMLAWWSPLRTTHSVHPTG